MAIVLIWLGIFGYLEGRDMLGYDHSATVQESELERALDDCKGSFRERYECKSALMRSSQQSSFYVWAKRLGLVFGPPLLVYILYNLVIKAIERKEEQARRKVRLARMEKEAEAARRKAKEEGRRKTIAAKRRSDVRQAEKAADREELPRPFNMLVVTERTGVLDDVAPTLLENGYFMVETDLTDAFLGYEEIGFHVVMADLEFKRQNEFGGFKENVAKLRELKENVRVVCMSPQFAALSPDQAEIVANEIKVDAVVGLPLDAEFLVEVLNGILDVDEADRKGRGDDDDDDDEYVGLYDDEDDEDEDDVNRA